MRAIPALKMHIEKKTCSLINYVADDLKFLSFLVLDIYRNILGGQFVLEMFAVAIVTIFCTISFFIFGPLCKGSLLSKDTP